MIKEDNVLTEIGWTINDISTVDYSVIRARLETLNAYGKPMLIRFASEFNCNALGNDAAAYVAMFRTVADMVHEYPNLGIVWSPVDIGGLDKSFADFYPGDEYVDWVGASCYSQRYFCGKQDTSDIESDYFFTGANSWATNKLKPLMNFLAEYNIRKPVMLSECGVATNNKYGEDCTAFAVPRLRNMLYSVIMEYPQIKLINYFNSYRENEIECYDISAYPYAAQIFNEAANSGAFIRELGGESDFVFTAWESSGEIEVSDNLLSVYATAGSASDESLEFRLDGEWYHRADGAPYRCMLVLDELADGVHTLEVYNAHERVERCFLKSGNSVYFAGEGEELVYETEEEITEEITEEETACEEEISEDECSMAAIHRHMGIKDMNRAQYKAWQLSGVCR